MGQKYKRFREFRTPFSLRDISKNPRSMYARVPQAIAQFVLKIEKLSHIMGPTPILEMAHAYGLRPRLWLLVPEVRQKLLLSRNLFTSMLAEHFQQNVHKSNIRNVNKCYLSRTRLSRTAKKIAIKLFAIH